MPTNIVLIGLSGSGKTSAGRILAEHLGWQFRDSDQLLAEQNGRSVAQIFAQQGEAAFRELETDMLAVLLDGSRQVISTGGGAVLREENRLAMLDGNLVVRLDAQPEVAIERMRNATTEERPLLTGTDPLERMRAMRLSREQYYRIAHLTIHTSHLTPHQVAQSILDEVGASPMRMSRIARLMQLDLAHTRLMRSAPITKSKSLEASCYNVHEVLLHVAEWEAEALRRIPLLLSGAAAQAYDVARFNEAALEANSSLSLFDAWKRFEQVHTQFADYLAGLPEEAFSYGSPVLEWVDAMANHSNEHAATFESAPDAGEE